MSYPEYNVFTTCSTIFLLNINTGLNKLLSVYIYFITYYIEIKNLFLEDLFVIYEFGLVCFC